MECFPTRVVCGWIQVLLYLQRFPKLTGQVFQCRWYLLDRRTNSVPDPKIAANGCYCSFSLLSLVNRVCVSLFWEHHHNWRTNAAKSSLCTTFYLRRNLCLAFLWSAVLFWQPLSVGLFFFFFAFSKSNLGIWDLWSLDQVTMLACFISSCLSRPLHNEIIPPWSLTTVPRFLPSWQLKIRWYQHLNMMIISAYDHYWMCCAVDCCVGGSIIVLHID